MRALITGISGQDGAYLAELLLDKGYRVFGGMRRTGSGSLWRLEKLGILSKVEILDMDMTEYESVSRAIEDSEPDEIYNLAAQSFVGSSFAMPRVTSNVNYMGVLNLLEAVRSYNSRLVNPRHAPKIYQASTSEMFGNEPAPQSERTRFSPRSPYGVAKAAAHHLCVNYRESYGMFIACGILFNHESPLRGGEFVTQKIARNIRGTLHLGNLDSWRDWGHARDYVRAMWLMLKHHTPKDFVIATGVCHTIHDFVAVAAKCAGVKPRVKIDPKFYRPAEVNILRGDARMAWRELGWKPEISFDNLVREMVEEADAARVHRV